MGDQVLDDVRAILARHTDQPRLFHAPPEEVSLLSLEIPSVEMIGIVIDLEERFGRAIDERRVHELRTVADLVHALEDACAVA